MTTGNLLYLIMCLVSFGAFSAVLAYVSRQPSQLDQAAAARGPAQASEPHEGITA